ncbi:complex I subunit 4 family protein [Fulvivirga sediminis]|uniref:NADH-quinone oxidoreductase subunit M n=1 Tax=Fulvivirga sediminis TaxID=2803949 RepID=A0A937F714_9BACT|nr:NADH-quinone oxidoreductase subunit M [Fulvivirga sediminis]MBL3657546.1 NADH-quinone oxidoreductase subunit M [Fulvivirga sediminis]
MLNNYLLSIIIFLPLIAALVVAFIPGKFKGAFKYIALGIASLQVLIAIVLLSGYDASYAGVNHLNEFQFLENVPWFDIHLSSFGHISADYIVGVDGLNMSMVLLSVVVMLIGTIASWNIKTREKGYFSLLLLLNGAILGCFLSLDFLLFYLFFEFMLLPMYFLIGLWGGVRREYASIKFFLYTLFGSIFILIAMIALNLSVVDPAATAVEAGLVQEGQVVSNEIVEQVQQSLAAGQLSRENLVHTFNMVYMTDPANYIPGSIMDYKVMKVILGQEGRLLMFLLLFIGFAIKIPVVPLHTWLPDAHVEAPTPISVILAGVLLKIGGYGLMRTAFMIIPDGVGYYGWMMGLLGVISIIYGALNALGSKDLKKMIAYSSVSHMGFVLLGLASGTTEGVSGAVYQMVSHGVISAALFLIVGVIYERGHDRIIQNYSGLINKMPRYTIFTVIFFFASLGLPGFSGFIAEIFVLLGSFNSSVVNGFLPKWMTIIAALGLIFSAAYYLWTIQRMFFGKFFTKIEVSNDELTDLNTREYVMLVPLVILALLMGVFPSFLLDMINNSIAVFTDVIGQYGDIIQQN